MKLFEMLFGKPVSTINPLELNDKLKNARQTLVIDVRQPDEYRSGHIAGAKLVPLGELNRKMQALPKNRQIVCVCASGSRSHSSTRTLVDAGYDAHNMQGGMSSWRQAGLPVKKGDAA